MDDRDFFYAVYISAALGAAIAVFLSMNQYRREQRQFMSKLLDCIAEASQRVSDTGAK